LIQQLKLEPITGADSMLGYFNGNGAVEGRHLQPDRRAPQVSIQQWITPKKATSAGHHISGNVTAPAVPTPMNYLTYLAGKGFDTTV
jgi:hypothetical protein